MTRNKTISLTLPLTVALLLQGCGGNAVTTAAGGYDIEFKHATNLKITDHEGYSVVELRNPWDTLKALQRLVLKEENTTLPPGYEGYTVLDVPLKRTVIYSSVHASLASELGVAEGIAGICDRDYIIDPKINNLLDSGSIADCGSSMNPIIEKIIKLKPDAVLLSPYESGGGEDKLERFGVPLVECADYMEPTPLGRAEWMKLYGRLYGKGSLADSIFNETEREYNELRAKASAGEKRPSVLFDRIYGQTWTVPGGKSTVGTLIRDAGGSNPFESYDIAGGVNLSPEKVMYEAGNADIWIIRYAKTPLTMKSLKDERPIYSQFDAYKNGKVYGSETIETNIFDDQAFHPQWVLSDLIRVIHPDIEKSEGKVYFEKLQDGD